MIPSATAAGSASSNTMTGALPPSSRWTRFSVSAAARAIVLPVSTSPVSETSRTSGCVTIRSPTGTPSPVTTFSTPAGRTSCGELGEAEQRERRLLGRLQHLDVACRERRRELPDRHHQRVVPGRDPADHAQRLAPDHRGVAAHVLARALALEQPRRAGEEAQVVDHDRHLVARVGERLADVRRLDFGELVGVLLEHARQLEQHRGALARGRIEPLRQRLLRRLDRRVDVLGRAPRNLGEHLLGRRVQHLHGLAGGSLRPAASDENPLRAHTARL